MTVSVDAGVTKYYSVPFTSGGITLRLDVSVGYITCYASDTFRNPGPGNYVWLINSRGYADGFIDPASQFGRTGTRFIYVALVGVDITNTYLFNSTTGNFSSQGESNTLETKGPGHLLGDIIIMIKYFIRGRKSRTLLYILMIISIS